MGNMGTAQDQLRKAGSVATRALIILVVIVLLGGAAYTWFTLHWSYSEGERAGLLQKFSRKGWLCKTSEGELAMYVVAGMAPQIWDFSSRDADIDEQLRKAVGHKVLLHYTEHRGVPSSCFAETGYFVDRVEVQAEDSPIQSGPTPPPAPPSAAPAASPATPTN